MTNKRKLKKVMGVEYRKIFNIYNHSLNHNKVRSKAIRLSTTSIQVRIFPILKKIKFMQEYQIK